MKITKKKILLSVIFFTWFCNLTYSLYASPFSPSLNLLQQAVFLLIFQMAFWSHGVRSFFLHLGLTLISGVHFSVTAMTTSLILFHVSSTDLFPTTTPQSISSNFSLIDSKSACYQPLCFRPAFHTSLHMGNERPIHQLSKASGFFVQLYFVIPALSHFKGPLSNISDLQT